MGLVTLGNAYEQAVAMAARHNDELVNVSNIGFSSLDEVWIGARPFPVSENAQQQICKRMEIPFPYLQSCKPDLQAENLNRRLYKENNEELFFRFDDQQLRAVFTPRYVPIDNVDLIEKLLTLFDWDTTVSLKMSGDMMSLSILDSHHMKVRDEEMHNGISINNSEIGRLGLIIKAFLFRLFCKNGAMITRGTSIMGAFRHISKKIMEKIPQVINENRVSQDWIERYMVTAMDRIVENPEELLPIINKKYELGPRQVEAVEWAWPHEKPLLVDANMFHVANTYTKAAQFEGLPTKEAYSLEKVGGNVFGLDPRMLKAA